MFMRLPRFRVAGLIGLIVACAIGFAALRYPSYTWANALIGLAAITLATTTLGAVMGRAGSFRGYAVFGWCYAVVTFGFVFFEAQAGMEEALHPVTRLLDLLYPIVLPEVLQSPPRSITLTRPSPPPLPEPAFLATGHALACLIFAQVGAILAGVLDRRPASGPTTTSAHPPAAKSF